MAYKRDFRDFEDAEDQEPPDLDMEVDGAEEIPFADEAFLDAFLPILRQDPKADHSEAVVKFCENPIIKEIPKDQDESDQEETPWSSGISPKVIEVYKQCGQFLKTYRSGKIPKPFRIIPNLTNWEEILAITQPLNWTPLAVYEATRLFISAFDVPRARQFLGLILLPAVRKNIYEYKKLHAHLYAALRKAMYKPQAFMRGILLPLAKKNCTVREAAIMSSVLGKASIPVFDAGAVLIKLCDLQPWYATTSILVKALLNKRYALPMSVIEAVHAHFMGFSLDQRALPVIWHQSLLVFVQRSKLSLNDSQIAQLKGLMKMHKHAQITPEILRELVHVYQDFQVGGSLVAAGGQTDKRARMEVEF